MFKSYFRLKIYINLPILNHHHIKTIGYYFLLYRYNDRTTVQVLLIISDKNCNLIL
jgi:hypothetical protein